MGAIFMNSENSKKSDFHGLLLTLANKINLKGVINMLLYLIVAFIIHGKV